MSIASAIRTGDVAELPSRRDEDWRWTDLRALIRTLPPASPAFGGLLADGPFDGIADEELLVVNGRGSTAIDLPAGDARSIALRFVAATSETAHAARVVITVGEGACLTLLESYEGEGSGYLAEAELDIRLAPNAALERIVLAADAADAVSVSQARITVSEGSSLSQTVLTTGARRQRIETHVAHPGAHAAVRLDGAYLIGEQRHGDITTVVSHGGVDGTTEQLIKGVVSGQGRAVFQGRIVVSEGADRTDARMGHHALLLSDRAEVDAKPELEIYADDVSCAHGNTVGALDDDALFYARQRGIPEDEAKALLTQAFVAEVIDRIADEGARDVARAWASARLGAG